MVADYELADSFARTEADFLENFRPGALERLCEAAAV